MSALKARSGPGVSKNTLTPAARGQFGFVFIPVAVTGLAEIVLVSGAVTFFFVIAVALVADALDEDERIERECQAQYEECLLTGLADLKGGLEGHTRCIICREACKKNGGDWKSWANATNGRVKCDYWNFKR